MTIKVWLTLIGASVVLISQGTWIFLDARKRGENYWLWGLYGLMNCPSSLLVYLWITRRRKIVCPDCGQRIFKNNQRCPHCGGAMQLCPACGAEVQVGWAFCPHCSCRL